MKIRTFLLSAASISAIMSHVALASAQAGSSADRDIVVTATVIEQRADETATPVVTLTGDELVHRRQANPLPLRFVQPPIESLSRRLSISINQ